MFEIDSYTDGQRNWTDAKRKTIEQCLEQIVNGVCVAAVYGKRMRAEREAGRQRSEKEQRRRMKQQAKVEILQRNVAKWEEAQRIRAYLAVVQQKAEGQDGGLKGGSPISRFLDWAHRYAEFLDPTNAAPEPEWADEEP